MKTYSDDWDEPQEQPSALWLPPSVEDGQGHLVNQSTSAEAQKIFIPASTGLPATVTTASLISQPAALEDGDPISSLSSEPALCSRDERAAIPIPYRGRPNLFPGFTARSALFRATKASGSFTVLTDVQAQGARLQTLGPKLDMRDKHIWEIAIELAKERASGVGERYEVELREFARRMGIRSPNSRALRSIWDSLSRLALARVVFELDGGKVRGVGSLIATACREGDRSFLRLNPDFALPALLCDRQFELNAKRRAGISSALGQWLHDFYSTHSKAHPIQLGYLIGLCGYEGAPKNFPGKLKEALDELMAAAPGVIASFEIKRTTRRFEDWQLVVQIGPEKRAFEQPKPMPSSTARKTKPAL